MMTKREKLLLGMGSILLVVLGALALWQLTRAESARRQLADTRTALELQRIESTLALAAIEADRDSYELARQLTSAFFTGLQANLDRTPDGTRPAFQEILLQRDAMITALSRSDPQSAPQLVRLLVRYRIALGEPVGPIEPEAPPPAEPGPAPVDSAVG